MKPVFSVLLRTAFCLLSAFGTGQSLTVPDPWLEIHARGGDPLYTTYAATIERSRLYGDKAYKMVYDSDGEPLHYWSDQAGRIGHVWMINKLVVDRVGKYFAKPVVTASFPDMALLAYQPFEGIRVQECFFVHSSAIALVDLVITNTSGRDQSVEFFPFLELGNDSLHIRYFDVKNRGYVLGHRESKERLISDLYKDAPYPVDAVDFFAGSLQPYSWGGFRGRMDTFYDYIKTDFYEENRSNDSLNFLAGGYVDFVSLQYKFDLKPGETKHLRYFRGVQDEGDDLLGLIARVNLLRDEPLQGYVDDNAALFAGVPRPDFGSAGDKMVYLGALNLARGCMLPPVGKTSHNFYVFSRNPVWGWGHGHQVLHESLSMLAYVYLDPRSAMESQRVYMEQQRTDGLIAYRHGPRGLQDYPHKGESTTSAPFFNWINLEIFRVAGDSAFLREAYLSGSRYLDWLTAHRDKDRDGTYEWGPYGIIENVRDWYNAVFQVSAERYLDVDKEDISDELECLDLSLMAANEMRCLSEMAGLLGRPAESKEWAKKRTALAGLINERMWDEESGFYYHVNMQDHGFRFMTRDLKRQEIIGFLPLWAGVATPERAARLVATLTDTARFWRKYGVPTLAADDVWYSPYVDYCCKWNGPVWLLWDYMVFRGLVDYGYEEAAVKLGNKMLLAVKEQLCRNHNFWESYSPDNLVLDCPSNYIWDAIMARLMIDLDALSR